MITGDAGFVSAFILLILGWLLADLAFVVGRRTGRARGGIGGVAASAAPVGEPPFAAAAQPLNDYAGW